MYWIYLSGILFFNLLNIGVILYVEMHLLCISRIEMYMSKISPSCC